MFCTVPLSYEYLHQDDGDILYSVQISVPGNHCKVSHAFFARINTAFASMGFDNSLNKLSPNGDNLIHFVITRFRLCHMLHS